jgi:hypothetical protein
MNQDGMQTRWEQPGAAVPLNSAKSSSADS